MHKFFVNKSAFEEDIVLITGDDAKHIGKVLRLRVGETINLNNYEGGEFLAKITEIDKKEVKALIFEKLLVNNESLIDVTLFQGVPKATKFDLIVQKSTELGVKEIIPVITKRVIVNSGEFKKLDRLNRISEEASKQSKRSIVPKISMPVLFKDMIDNIKTFDLIVVPYENAENYGIRAMISEIDKDKIKKIGIVIGPEGGFEEEEIDLLKEIGAKIVTLGPRILRTETAGFVCTSILMYELSDLGGNI